MQVFWDVPPENDGVKLGVFLRRQGVSLTLVRRLKYHEDGLLCNGQRARTNLPLQVGDRVALTLPQEPFSAEPEEISLDICYRDDHALVVNKPAGMLTHPVGPRRSGTLANGVSGWMQRQGMAGMFRPVGRLDADTSGLLLCALTPLAAPLLAASMQKTYLALVSGRLAQEQGEIDLPLGPAPGSAILQQAGEGGRPSCTAYQVLAKGEAASLVKVQPRTGRTHQIRAHFAALGHPLLGDALYGGSTTHIVRQALHCAGLRFQPPQEGEQQVTSGLPADIQQAAAALGLPDLPNFRQDCIISE